MQQSALSTLFSQISLTCGHDEVEYCQGQATCTLLLCKLNNSFQESHYHIHDLAYLMDQLSNYVLHANCIIEDNILKSWLYTCIVGKSSVKCDLNLERKNQKTWKQDYMIFSWTCGTRTENIQKKVGLKDNTFLTFLSLSNFLVY